MPPKYLANMRFLVYAKIDEFIKLNFSSQKHRVSGKNISFYSKHYLSHKLKGF